jgi:hypothetical protein
LHRLLNSGGAGETFDSAFYGGHQLERTLGAGDLWTQVQNMDFLCIASLTKAGAKVG